MDEKWVICVVVLEEKNPRKYENYYVAVAGKKEEAELLQNRIAKTGFKADERRFFPDEIETLSLKKHGEK
jgi:hypothetical protein